jgi:hypothetical protein
VTDEWWLRCRVVAKPKRDNVLTRSVFESQSNRVNGGFEIFRAVDQSLLENRLSEVPNVFSTRHDQLFFDFVNLVLDRGEEFSSDLDESLDVVLNTPSLD